MLISRHVDAHLPGLLELDHLQNTVIGIKYEERINYPLMPEYPTPRHVIHLWRRACQYEPAPDTELHRSPSF